MDEISETELFLLKLPYWIEDSFNWDLDRIIRESILSNWSVKHYYNIRTVNNRKVLMMQQAWDSVWGDVISMDMVSTMYSMCVSVFPNVPERPGLPCTGEDREYFFLFYLLSHAPPPQKKLASFWWYHTRNHKIMVYLIILKARCHYSAFYLYFLRVYEPQNIGLKLAEIRYILWNICFPGDFCQKIKLN